MSLLVSSGTLTNFVPAKFIAFTTELRIARILDGEFNGRAVKYNHFELKNIAFHGLCLLPDNVSSTRYV